MEGINKELEKLQSELDGLDKQYKNLRLVVESYHGSNIDTIKKVELRLAKCSNNRLSIKNTIIRKKKELECLKIED